MILIDNNTLLQSDAELFFLFFSIIMAAACCWLTFYYLKRARLIEDTPTSKIRSAAQGYVEIVGTVSSPQKHMLSAPLSNTACVWFTYKIQRHRRSGKSSHWSTIEEKTSTEQFVVSDDTGNCVIDPIGAEVQTSHSHTWYGYTKKPNHPNNTKSFFKIIGGKRYRYIEKLIRTHDSIYALGNFKSSGGGRCIPNNHQMTGTVIREWKHNYNHILNQFDQDKNGVLDMIEWEKVRTAASREAEERRQELSRMPTVYTLCNTIQKHHPFILSTFSQKKLAQKYRNLAFFSLLGLIIFTALILMQLINTHTIDL
ncbi:E3 Ubiquitin ligase [Nitrosomonas sp. Nm51]|uniref:GIDE domain-containing protein n=1 Tax=Nitrosomonas sp. Nm51 TaxID=133720 RepID=UPI0008D8453E|nr:GIDE domain-containing protein [Nitrosomonas sp. Nm51]SER27878.1 E3 Ubiquitin ligase [Nitrosomonas sp. Nm51]